MQPVTTPAHDHDTDGGDRAPATPVEQILADIYAQVLGLSHVGVDESFFDLGGDSLSAMRVIAAINTALDTQLALPTLFDTPSIASLSQQLGGQAEPGIVGISVSRARIASSNASTAEPAGCVRFRMNVKEDR